MHRIREQFYAAEFTQVLIKYSDTSIDSEQVYAPSTGMGGGSHLGR